MNSPVEVRPTVRAIHNSGVTILAPQRTPLEGVMAGPICNTSENHTYKVRRGINGNSINGNLINTPPNLPVVKHGEELKPFASFYEEADIRSHKMDENLFFQGSHQAAGISLLITGGFHTTQLTTLLKKKSVPYIVVSPKLTNITDDSGSTYLAEFSREKTPLEKLFLRDRLFVIPANVLGASSNPEAGPLNVEMKAGSVALKDGEIQKGGEVVEVKEQGQVVKMKVSDEVVP
jgi:hypothetical protein